LSLLNCHGATASEKASEIGGDRFWSTVPVDPLNVALRFWTVSGDVKAEERIVFRARQQIKLRKGWR